MQKYLTMMRFSTKNKILIMECYDSIVAKEFKLWKIREKT